MDRTEILAGVDFVRGVMEYHRDRLAAGHTETDAEAAAWDDGHRYIEEQSALVRRIDERDQQLARAAEFLTTHPTTVAGDGTLHVPNLNTRTGEDPFDLSTMSRFTSASDLRGRALTAVEKMPHADDKARSAAVDTLERFDDSRGSVAERYLLTGSEAYRSGFAKAIAGRTHALTPDESAALDRAASLTDGSGGYAVPFLLDPSVTLTSNGTNNPFRQISRIVRGTSDVWNGVNSAGISAGWVAEGVENTDNAPTLTAPAITAHKASAFVPYSIEIDQDWQQMQSEMSMMLMDAKDVLEGAAFATGSGTGQPVGIVTALVASSPSVITASAGSNVFAKADLYNLIEAVPPRFRGNGAWVCNLAITNDIRAFGSTYDAFTVDLTAGGVAQLLGRPLYESSDMDGTYGSGENYVLVYGDWSNYVIFDRIGMSVELIPHVFGTTNNYPTGQRGLYAHWRVGADSRNDAAFSVLNIT